MKALCEHIMRIFSIIPNLIFCLSNIKRNVKIGKNVKLDPRHLLSNVNIGDFTYIAPNSSIRNTSIGKYCSIGENFISGAAIHPTNCLSSSPLFYSTRNQCGKVIVKENTIEEYKPVKVGNDVFIGANVTILSGVTIGDGAILAAGAVVVKDVDPYSIVGGVPAKHIKFRFDSHIVNRLLEIKWWNWPEDKQSIIVDHFFNIEEFIKKY